MKSKLLYCAMFLIILSIPLRGDESEFNWLWSDQLWVPLTMAMTALLCIALHIYKTGLRESSKGIDSKR